MLETPLLARILYLVKFKVPTPFGPALLLNDTHDLQLVADGGSCAEYDAREVGEIVTQLSRSVVS